MKAYSKILTFCGVVLIIAGVLLLIASPLALTFAVLGVILIANARMVRKSAEPEHQGEPEEAPQTATVSQEPRKDDSSRAETVEPVASVPPPTPEEIKEADARFRAGLAAIPDRTEIARSGKKRARYDLVGFPELKTSNIISTSHLDRLGSFAVIDVETTGLKPAKDRIVEVSAIRFDGWEPVGRFSTLVNPEMHIPDDAARIHGITDEDVTDAPVIEDVIESLSAFVGPATVVGHNVKFDLQFLYCSGWNLFDGRRRYYDTCQLARTVLLRKGYPFTDRTDYDVENYKLTTLCDFYRIRDNAGAHRSLSDAYATAILFRNLAEAKAKN